jgi:hypothetical protein
VLLGYCVIKTSLNFQEYNAYWPYMSKMLLYAAFVFVFELPTSKGLFSLPHPWGLQKSRNVHNSLFGAIHTIFKCQNETNV